MKITPIAALIAAALMLSACGATGPMALAGPGEAFAAKVSGKWDSYFEQGLDYLAEQLCANPTRDPVTGDCE